MADDPGDPEIARLRAHISALETERDGLKARERTYQAIFDRVSDRLVTEAPNLADNRKPGRFEGLSFVIVYYDIPQQIERTLASCAPGYQRVGPGEIEVILVDNGSPAPLPDDLTARFPHVGRIVRVDGHPSPVVALNRGIAEARFEAVALMIDGAHMLSPGIARNIRALWTQFENPVVSVPQFFLGLESQNLSDAEGAFERETSALSRLNWPEDGYALFRYALYPGETYHRSYVDAIETNCLITSRRVLDRCGGFDERFDEPGGGFANLEIYSRLIHDPQNSYIVLPGEGSFHQDHRGVTTHRAPEDRDRLVATYRARYRDLTGSDAVVNLRSPFLFGKTRRQTQHVPTISREFGKVTHHIQQRLANIYVGRVRAGIREGDRPALIFGKAPDERLARVPLAPLGLLPETAARQGVEPSDLDYLDCLRTVHRAVQPKLYFEIGVDTGASLRLAACKSIGVDPAYWISSNLTQPTRLFRQTSDAFFANEKRCAGMFGEGIELAFIDGMHLAENVLRDFIATERYMRPGGVVLLDDVLPEQMEMLERERRYNAWCGDVCKILPILKRYRPDLTISVFETFIGPYRKGLALISGVDPENKALAEAQGEIEADLASGVYDIPSIEALEASLTLSPRRELERDARGGLVDLAARSAAPPPQELACGTLAPNAPLLSVVVVAFDMARELPRTLKTLSAAMQCGMSDAEYEILVMDNGSAAPADPQQCVAVAPNARVFSVRDGGVSPCRAANAGIALAKGARIAVMIDGARMASPGLLRAGLQALEEDPAAVVGTHGFHLGDTIQQDAVAAGYDAAAEDARLESLGWQADGYRLFGASVFSKSSGKGWRAVPSETTALFLHRQTWQRLNGYDERFSSPGGGLANLDIWKRACETPGHTVTLLLGEATFHQVHGGVTTGASSPRTSFDREYEMLRGQPYQRPSVPARFLGREPGDASA